jgi:hypothetical protein
MKEFLIASAIVLSVALAGRLWARLPLGGGRAAAWLMLLGSVAALAELPGHPVARMVMLCSTLFTGMKSLVYVEWSAAGRRLGWAGDATWPSFSCGSGWILGPSPTHGKLPSGGPICESVSPASSLEPLVPCWCAVRDGPGCS